MVTDPEPTEEELDRFWRRIEQAEGDQAKLRDILMKIPKAEVYSFQNSFIEMTAELQDEPYINYIGPDESEDGLADISRWVVSQGRSTYESVLADPSLMPRHVDVGDPKNLFDIGYDVYETRFGEELDLL